MAGFKLNRTSEDIRRELMDILRSMKDPRISGGMISVVRIELTNDLSHCKVYISSLEGMEKAKEAVIEILKNGIKKSGVEYIAIAHGSTTVNGKVFDKATVGREFAKFAEEAALQGDEAAIDILKKASLELFRNVDAAYENANFKDKEQCELLLSGSAIVKNKSLRYMLNKRSCIS